MAAGSAFFPEITDRAIQEEGLLAPGFTPRLAAD